MKPVRGFSLIEIMVVVAIVAILASIAVPAYRDYVMRGKLAEAYTVLASQRVKMEQFYQDRRTYDGACAAGTVAPAPTGTYFTYKCDIKDQTYTITATGVTAQGVPDFAFTIDQSNNRTTAATHSGWSYPSPNNCWIRSKDGKC
jgi:type IV pilus assembly protein PilE